MCKPHKMAKACRWKVKELDKLRRDEAACRQARFRKVPLSDLCPRFKRDRLELKDIKCPIRPAAETKDIAKALRGLGRGHIVFDDCNEFKETQ